jgi:hypothetical protein
MNRYLMVLVPALLLHLGAVSLVRAADGPSAQQVLTAASQDEKYTFIVFRRDNGPATQSMVQVTKRGVDSRADRATVAYVDVTDPTEKATVDRFGVSRAPLPLTVAVAPNGAITAMFPKKVTDEQIEKAFVTPVMARCMKAMQQGKLVLVCVEAGHQSPVPPGVQDFQQDPQFKDRTEVISLRSNDPAEADFLVQLKIDPSTTTQPTVAFLAPPAVLVGKFSASVTKDDMAAALHAAGKCCDDPNCKHNHPGKQTKQPSTGSSRQATQSPAARRN